MKKSVKVVIGAVFAVIAVIAGVMYMMTPEKVKTITVSKGQMEDTLELEANVISDEGEVILSGTSGIVTEVLCRTGEQVEAGEEVVRIDDQEYQQDLTDQIEGLKKQKAAIYGQGESNQLQLALQQQQLQAQITSAVQEYDLMFGENGTAVHNENAAKYARDTAQATYEAAVDTNKEWKNLKKEGKAEGSNPYSSDQLIALSSAYSEASEAYENAKLANSAQQRQYYLDKIEALKVEYNTISDSIARGATGIQQNAGQVQTSIDTLTRKQEVTPAAPIKSGIVAELLVENGSYVVENQPLVRLYQSGNKKLEAWMLTDDVVFYHVGDAVQVSLPDDTVVEEKITFISPLAEQQLSTLGVNENRCRVELSADHIPEQMGPGYEVTLHFSRALAEDAIQIPVSALANENQETIVYTVENGICRKMAVTTGVYSGGFVEILSGLSDGQQIIDHPGDYELKDGAKIEVLP